MMKHTYKPMKDAPKDRPIIAVCGGVEMAVMWHNAPISDWCYWDEDDDIDGCDLVRGEMRGWRALF